MVCCWILGAGAGDGGGMFARELDPWLVTKEEFRDQEL